ncbi:MAG: hypothetical protein NUV73_01050 [Candidatus Daviesbacteria bacterium]|nr:hypothetical protein [Candidatus Daviesbacteria bacterium]
MEKEPLDTATEPLEEIMLLESHGMQKGIIAQRIINSRGEKLSAIPMDAKFVVYHPRHQHLMAAYQAFDGTMYWQHFECHSAEVVPLNFSAS